MNTRTRRTQADRSAATRKTLLTAAINSLHQVGYSATTTISVAEIAGVSRGAMLHQFPTKADLMTFVVESVYEDELRVYDEIMKGLDDPRERLLRYPKASWEVLGRPSGLAVLEILQASRSDAQLAEKLRPIQARIEAQAFHHLEPQLGPGRTAELLRLIVWTVRGLSIENVLATKPGQVARSIQLFTDLVEAAITTGYLVPGASGDEPIDPITTRTGRRSAVQSRKRSKSTARKVAGV